MSDPKKMDELMNEAVSRRGFMTTLGAATTGVLMGSCGKKSNPTKPENQNQNTSGEVALAKLENYQYDALKNKLIDMFDQIGGISDVIPQGAKVAIKVNFTGGLWAGKKMLSTYGCRAEDSVWTNDFVLRAVGELLKDAGASKLYVVEGQEIGITQDFTFGYGMVLLGLGAQFIDLNNKTPYGDFVELPVSNGYNFDSFKVNGILSEVDAYVSIPKMKCHYTAGITLTMKNNVGMVSGTEYGNGTRWNLHGPNGDLSKASWHLPRTIVDLNLAQPVNLTIIDGISTMDKGEGDWVPNVKIPYATHALLAGKDALKTDAVAMQVMGFDPLSAHYSAPFVVGENWLLKAQEKGFGNPDPSKITVAGASPDDFPRKFHACDANPEVTGKAAYQRMAPYCGMHPNDQGRG